MDEVGLGSGYQPLELEGADAPPVTPRKVNVRCSTVKLSPYPGGRIIPLVTTIENLPKHCTVRDLQLLMYDYFNVPIRQPIELRYWGKPLDLDKMLKHYAIKEHSEITVVIKPKLPDGVPCGTPVLERIRLTSHNLQGPIAIDGINNDMTVLDVKGLLQAQLKAQPIWLTVVPVDAATAEKTGMMMMQTGDHFVTDPAGGYMKGKGVAKVKRVRDGVCGVCNEADLALLVLQPEQMTLMHDGVMLPDESPLGSCGLVNNERIYLDFKLPWPQPWVPDPDAAPPKGGGGDKKGGKKKK